LLDGPTLSGESFLVAPIHRFLPFLVPAIRYELPGRSAWGGDEFFQTGQVSIGDKLNELPALRSTFSTANSTRFLGTAGLSLLDLYGLGPQRTLVLVNGRRHVAGDILSNAVSPDINTIPTDLIDRVDVVTGGNSAIYGSDAISGVVNFILKDHYDGFQVRGQGGISGYGDAGSYYTSVLAGHNFSEDRGNIAVNLEYARQQDYYGSDRPNTRNTNGFVVVDTDPAGSVNGSDGNPDRVFLRNIRSATIANGGLLQFSSPTGACGRDASGVAFTCNYLFQPDGTLVPQTGTRVGIGPNGSFLGGNGSNLREGRQLVLQPRQNRYSVNLLGHYEISDALVPFMEAKFVRVAYNNEGYVILGYQIANRTVGSDWIMLDVGITLMEKVKANRKAASRPRMLSAWARCSIARCVPIPKTARTIRFK